MTHAVALCSYEGVGAELIRVIKYRNRRQPIGPMVEALAPSLSHDIDVVVAVPSAPERIRERGFDLTGALAKRLARKLQVEVANPLERVSKRAQIGAGRTERENIAFRTRCPVAGRVLLVDDVVTTGATALACAVALGAGGADAVSFVALAATPPPAKIVTKV